MEIPKIQNPTPEQVDEIHAKFKQCLIDLFEEQKHTYLKDAENVKLEILQSSSSDVIKGVYIILYCYRTIIHLQYIKCYTTGFHIKH